MRLDSELIKLGDEYYSKLVQGIVNRYKSFQLKRKAKLLRRCKLCGELPTLEERQVVRVIRENKFPAYRVTHKCKYTYKFVGVSWHVMSKFNLEMVITKWNAQVTTNTYRRIRKE